MTAEFDPGEHVPAFAAAAPGAGWLHALPMPATLLELDGRVVDANPAFGQLVGWPLPALRGRALEALQPEDERESAQEMHRSWRQAGAIAPAWSRRLVDAAGEVRWFSVVASALPGPAAAPMWLALWHDSTAEVAARTAARQAQDELAQWFELAGIGMLVYDEGGLVVRCNAAFEQLVHPVPPTLDEAAPELQALLGWLPAADARAGGRPAAPLVPGAPPVERQAQVAGPDGRRRRLVARLASPAGEFGPRRVLAVVQDRSAEEERDLAQLEMGMLMDTASVGVATYDPERGWLAAPPREPRTAPAGAARPAGSGALLGISRDLVEPESVPEYEKLQRALRAGERTEVRYAVRHPELGARWLQTRVEPRLDTLGRATTSVVTLDITDQERSRRRNEQLLRELTTILDSSTAGIAYLRGPVLARCNRRFERMLGFPAGAAAGATLHEIFARTLGGVSDAAAALRAVAEGRAYESELRFGTDSNEPDAAVWYSLSVRAAPGPEPAAEPAAALAGAPGEAVAVLTDITRLKQQQAELERLLRDRELMFSLSEVGIVYQRGPRIERANQAMAALTGWTATELSTLDVAELYPSARECVDFEQQVATALRASGRFSGERPLKRRDGQLVWVQVAVRPVDGAFVGGGVICSFVDIDDRRRAREALAGQAERTRAVLNSVLVGIVTVSASGIEWMNRSARRMFGGELADFVGEALSTVATPDPAHPLRRVERLAREGLLAEGESESFECRLRGRDGREFWVVGNAVRSGAAGSGGPELTVALLDIERRRQAEVRIAQAQEGLQRVIESAPLAIALFDAASGRVLQHNQVALALLADPAFEAALAAWRAEPEAALAATRQREWRSGGAATAPGDAAREPGRVWDMRLTGLPEQLLLVASDVTEQRAAERARLQAAIAQREVLVREVHHRIKNNLQGVAGLLQQNAQRHPEISTLLLEAVAQVQAIAQVYGLQVGAAGPLPALAPLVRAIGQSVQRTFGRPIDVELEGALEHVLPEAESIPVALVINELLTNAVKHATEAGAGGVRCRLEPHGEGVRVTISNPGRLPGGFDIAAFRPGTAGLGLVRALLPRRSASLSLEEAGGLVLARVELRPPGVRLPEPAARTGPDDALAAQSTPS